MGVGGRMRKLFSLLILIGLFAAACNQAATISADQAMEKKELVMEKDDEAGQEAPDGNAMEKDDAQSGYQGAVLAGST